LKEAGLCHMKIFSSFILSKEVAMTNLMRCSSFAYD
jgi:hypothetical protein